jgi:hypothetical protein
MGLLVVLLVTKFLLKVLLRSKAMLPWYTGSLMDRVIERMLLHRRRHLPKGFVRTALCRAWWFRNVFGDKRGVTQSNRIRKVTGSNDDGA